LKLHVTVYLEKTKLIERTVLVDYLEKAGLAPQGG